MTANELRQSLAKEYGLGKYPEQLAVNADTFAHVCAEIFAKKCTVHGKIGYVYVAIGPSAGIMFKYVELIFDPEMK